MLGNPGTLRPEVGAWHVGPLLAQRAAAGAGDLHRRDEAVGREAGGEHQHVRRALRAIPVRIPLGVTSAIRSATTSTLGFVSVGYQSSVSMIRL